MSLSKEEPSLYDSPDENQVIPKNINETFEEFLRLEPAQKRRNLISGQTLIDPINGGRLEIGRRTKTRNMFRRDTTKYSNTNVKMISEIEKGPLFGERLEVNESNISEDSLWVNKYSPRRFTELTSSDQVNLEVLRWINQWKNINNRPEKTILLLSGPPGLGKTTLVQIAAQTAGFKVVEINASDERSGDIIQHKVKTALETDSISFTGAASPNLLLLDEIDGALNTDTGLIKQITKLASIKNHEEGDQSSDSIENLETSKSKTKKKIVKLSRPIVCICNDLYAPALKPLRQAAHVIQLKRPSPIIIAKRLKFICEAEGLRVDNKVLLDLCDLLEGDIRACLHALQFVYMKKTTVRSISDFSTRAIKDYSRSPYYALQQIFFPFKSYDLDEIENLVSKDEDRIIDSCFDFYLQSKFFDDSRLTKVNEVLDWISITDSSKKAIASCVLKTSRLFASPNPHNANVKFKFSDFELSQRMNRNKSILKSHKSHAKYSNESDLVLDKLPLLNQIVRPLIKSANPQLLKPVEKLALDRLIKIMSSEGLCYIELKSTEASNLIMILDPPIDNLVTFCTPASLNLSSQEIAVRKLIASQIQQENIRHLQSKQGLKNKSEEKSEPLVKKPFEPQKDFFGRVVPATSKTEFLPKVEQKNSETIKTWYRYNEGFSNAVRRNIRIKALFSSSFLSE